MIEEGANHLISNQPPLSEQVAMDIEERLAILADRKAAVLASVERVVINSNEAVGSAADLVAIANTLLEDAEEHRKAVKKPLDQAAHVVQAKANGWSEEVVEAVKRVEGMIRKFRADQREAARKQAQEQREAEERARAEAAAAEKGKLAVDPPKPVEPVKASDISLPTARGNYGSKVSDKRERIYTITDPRKLPDQILNAPKVREAMLAAIKQLSKLSPEIEGTEASWSTGEAIRKGA